MPSDTISLSPPRSPMRRQPNTCLMPTDATKASSDTPESRRTSRNTDAPYDHMRTDGDTANSSTDPEAASIFSGKESGPDRRSGMRSVAICSPSITLSIKSHLACPKNTRRPTRALGAEDDALDTTFTGEPRPSIRARC